MYLSAVTSKLLAIGLHDEGNVEDAAFSAVGWQLLGAVVQLWTQIVITRLGGNGYTKSAGRRRGSDSGPCCR